MNLYKCNEDNQSPIAKITMSTKLREHHNPPSQMSFFLTSFGYDHHAVGRLAFEQLDLLSIRSSSRPGSRVPSTNVSATSLSSSLESYDHLIAWVLHLCPSLRRSMALGTVMNPSALGLLSPTQVHPLRTEASDEQSQGRCPFQSSSFSHFLAVTDAAVLLPSNSTDWDSKAIRVLLCCVEFLCCCLPDCIIPRMKERVAGNWCFMIW